MSTERVAGGGTELDAIEHARTLALRSLNQAPRTRHQLSELLARRGVDEEVAQVLLDRFEEVGLLDDAAYARSLVRSRVTERGLARRALAQELRRKGIEEDVAATALADIEPDDEERAARDVVRRKIRGMSQVDGDVATRRLVAVLGRKGYPAGLAYRVVREELGLARDAGDEGVEP